ncbi:MAG TPA: serine/threonine-protein kinase [Polyangiaceae bacterium]|nr:serine/threonine-protein kinase [Polyangiaceae bacterium]
MSHSRPPFRAVAGYVIGERLASGGMGSIHLGIKTGALGFQRVVAIKRLHPELATDPEFSARFKDEIRLTGGLTHTNIVQTLDVVEAADELMLVMECVEGETLAVLLGAARARGTVLALDLVSAVVTQALHGLHAAHESMDDAGRRLAMIHRDVSPHNIMINKDGVVKVLDFGIAKAALESHVTRAGHVCGKLAYMSPEQLRGRPLDRRVDVFSAGVVLWESLSGQRLFGDLSLSDAAAVQNVLLKQVVPPSRFRSDVSPALERVVMRALAREPDQRFGTALEFAVALNAACPSAPPAALAQALTEYCGPRLERRAQLAANFRRELKSSTTSAPVAFAREPSDAPADSRESETRDVGGVVVLDDERRTSSLRQRWLLGASVALSVVVAALGLRAFSSHRKPEPRVVSTSAARPEVVPVVPPSAPVEFEVASVVERPLTIEQLPAEGASTQPIVEPPVTSPHAPIDTKPKRLPRARPSAEPTAPATPPPAEPQCSPPTYTDADGIRHFKPGCI